MQLTCRSAVDLGQGRVISSLSSAVGGRLVAMSLLVQNTSPEIANGGTISIGRLNRDLSPFSPVANLISSTRINDIHQGPAASGGYAWWMPRENIARQYADLADATRTLSAEPYLYCQISGWGGASASSVAITVCYVVDFTILSQLYEKRSPPPMTRRWDEMYNILANVPAASCNPEHKQIFSDYLKKAKSTVDSVAEHYQKYKDVYNLVFEGILAALAAA